MPTKTLTMKELQENKERKARFEAWVASQKGTEEEKVEDQTPEEFKEFAKQYSKEEGKPTEAVTIEGLQKGKEAEARFAAHKFEDKVEAPLDISGIPSEALQKLEEGEPGIKEEAPTAIPTPAAPAKPAKLAAIPTAVGVPPLKGPGAKEFAQLKDQEKRLNKYIADLPEKSDRLWWNEEKEKIKSKFGGNRTALAWIIALDALGKGLISYQSAQDAKAGGYASPGLQFDKLEWGKYFSQIRQLEADDLAVLNKEMGIRQQERGRVEQLTNAYLGNADRMRKAVEHANRVEPKTSNERKKDYDSGLKKLDKAFASAKKMDEPSVDLLRTQFTTALSDIQPPLGDARIKEIMERSTWFGLSSKPIEDSEDMTKAYLEIRGELGKAYFGANTIPNAQIPASIKKQFADGGGKPIYIGPDAEGKTWLYEGEEAILWQTR